MYNKSNTFSILALLLGHSVFCVFFRMLARKHKIIADFFFIFWEFHRYNLISKTLYSRNANAKRQQHIVLFIVIKIDAHFNYVISGTIKLLTLEH